jgi:hypothetical protein
MLHIHNSVVNFYRIRLTVLSIFNSLRSNSVRQMGISALKASRWAVVFGGLAVAAAGCAAVDKRPPAEIVKERAEARLKAVLAGDGRTVYQYLTPTIRKTLTVEEYVARVPTGFWKAASIEKVDCPRENVCDVSLNVEYAYKGSRIRTPVKEAWIQEDRNWWYAVKD